MCPYHVYLLFHWLVFLAFTLSVPHVMHYFHLGLQLHTLPCSPPLWAPSILLFVTSVQSIHNSFVPLIDDPLVIVEWNDFAHFWSDGPPRGMNWPCHWWDVCAYSVHWWSGCDRTTECRSQVPHRFFKLICKILPYLVCIFTQSTTVQFLGDVIWSPRVQVTLTFNFSFPNFLLSPNAMEVQAFPPVTILVHTFGWGGGLARFI